MGNDTYIDPLEAWDAARIMARSKISRAPTEKSSKQGFRYFNTLPLELNSAKVGLPEWRFSHKIRKSSLV